MKDDKSLMDSIKEKLNNYIPKNEKSVFLSGGHEDKFLQERPEPIITTEYYIVDKLSTKLATGPYCEEELQEVIMAFPLGTRYSIVTKEDLEVFNKE